MQILSGSPGREIFRAGRVPDNRSISFGHKTPESRIFVKDCVSKALMVFVH
jgi:hypothetical protein